MGIGGQVAVQHPRVEYLAAALRLHGEVAVAVDAALVRAVEDLPVDQPAAAGQPDATGADAAERKRNLPQVFAGVHTHGALTVVRVLMPCRPGRTGKTGKVIHRKR